MPTRPKNVLLEALRSLKLLRGRGAQKTLLQLCHAERLEGGLSVSLRATPDELVGPLTHALGGVATKLKVLDVRTTRPLVVEVQAGAVHEKWELEDVEALVHNLNDLYRDEPAVRALVVLGEWEDMLQLWCVEKPLLPKLFAARLLDDARNRAALVRAMEGPDSPEDW